MTSINASYRNDINKNVSLNTEVFYDKGYYTSSDNENMKMNHETFGTKIKVSHRYHKQNELLYGLDWYRQHAHLGYDDYKIVSFKKKTYAIQPLSFNYDRTIKGLFLMNKMERGKWLFTQGIRKETTDWGFDKTAKDGAGATVRKTNNTAWELSTAYQYNDIGKIYARYERSYTLPDGIQVADVVGKGRNKKYVATSAKDEHYDNYELGWRDKIGVNAISLTLFASNTNNQMNRPYIFINGSLQQRTFNFLKTHRKGLDLNVTQQMGKLRLTEGITFLKGRTEYNDEGLAFIKNNPGAKIDWSNSNIKKVPTRKALFKADYKFDDKISAGIQWMYFGRYNNFFKKQEAKDANVMKSHSLVDLYFKYNPNERMHYYGGVTNLFNKRYYEYAGDNMDTFAVGQDRMVYMGLNYNF